MRSGPNGLLKTLSVVAMGLLAACGSVHVDKEPDGAGGGDGSGGAGGSSGAGGLDARQVCLDYCNARNASGCETTEPDCAGFCEERIESAGAECEDKAGVLFACVLPLASTCPIAAPPSCQEEMDAVDTCMETHGCGFTQACSGGGGEDGEDGEACSCEATCLGKRHETRCETPAGGATTCACLVDGVEVGTCEGESAGMCGVKEKESCCQEYFNIP
ncbi:hypothetical protein WMF04_23200 [Sorangium sp. So ce260]|uniref:hypothetical protein n=1 Tax=Sorangium sp. So ce260 TaxID=3133291 RepID=UPI003F6045AA